MKNLWSLCLYLTQRLKWDQLWRVNHSCSLTSAHTPALLVYLQTWVSLNFPPPLTFIWASGSFPPVRDSFDTSFIYIMTTCCLHLWASVIMWLSAIIKQLSPLMDAVFPFANEWETGSLFPCLCLSTVTVPGELVFMGVPVGLSAWITLSGLHLWVQHLFQRAQVEERHVILPQD